ncbi:hypothetical protein F5148DRAFT_800622 [Russula earlei]|uniref:Uncharacterized protein n=1 Tax=Russula earlei TaxID=71964 RepID=A0ACC0UBW4_9AGAM|nr:hypothetical protein F5148DRAFT_800622 [Russula earlei]
MSFPKSALILGATGETGRQLLRELITSPTFTRVCEAGRRVTSTENLPVQARGKLEQKVINFERLDEARLNEGKWDVVFITSVPSVVLHRRDSLIIVVCRLGTTAKLAGSQEKFTKIDRDYVVNAAKAAKVDKDQRLIYISAPMANPESSIFYSRSKGLTEQALAELGYKDTIIFRPAALANTQRSDSRLGERTLLAVTGILSRFTTRLEIGVDKLAKSARIVGELGTSGLPPGIHAPQMNWGGRNFTMIDNQNAVALSG